MARRFVVGTAGHVDHGKTTLVRALTGIDTDRLPEEKRRGITIELGFAPLALPGGLEVSLVDVPGHKRLVHTMIAGAAGMELVLLVVAADEGVMPQTREHLAACELLGIRRVVVALTKLDRTPRDLAELAAEEVGELLAGRFEHATVLCSARTGEGIDDLRNVLARELGKLAPAPIDRPAHLAIDRVFSVRGAGTVVTGTLVRGTLAVGDAVRVVGPAGERTSSVRGLHVHDRAVPRVEAPTRLAVNLHGLATDDVARGDVVTTHAALAATSRFDLAYVRLARVSPRAELEVHVGTARAPGRLQVFPESEPDAGEANEAPCSGPLLARVRLARPLVVGGDERVVLRLAGKAGATGGVVGGGRVLDARAPLLRRRKARLSALDAAARGDGSELARSLAKERAPRPLAPSELGARFPLESAPIARALDKLADRGEVVRLGDDGHLDRDAVVELARRARALVSAHHDAHPLDRGLRLETLRQKLAVRGGLSAAAEAIRLAARKGIEGDPIVVDGDIARLAGFVEGRGRAPGSPLEKAAHACAEAALRGLGEFAITELLGIPGKEVRAVLAKLVRDGALVAIGGQWFDRAAVDGLRAAVVAHLATNDTLSIAHLKELSGLGRKQAIPLLELFDREGTTLRRPDDHRARGPKFPAR
jgi:selenocysteine-specific elongation factor